MASKPRHLLQNENRSLKKRVEDLEAAVRSLQHTIALRVPPDRLGPRPMMPTSPYFPNDPAYTPHEPITCHA